MKIIKTTTEDKKMVYQMTKAADIQRLQDNAGKEITVEAYCLYQDERQNGDVVTVLSIRGDGRTVATNSPTFIETFGEIEEIAGNIIGERIRVDQGTSKAGRTFYSCVWC